MTESGCSRVAFISGHIDLTREQFEREYVYQIKQAISEGCSFVVGNAIGCDAFALEYLAKHVDRNRVTVYHRESAYDKIHKEHLTMSSVKAMDYQKIHTGFRSFEERDKHMTLASDFDIAWVRPDLETKTLMEQLGKVYKPNRISGTLKNIQRRMILGSSAKSVV